VLPPLRRAVNPSILRRETPLSCAGKFSGQLFYYNQRMDRLLALGRLPLKGDQVRPPKDDR
jgi:hypothetical protein